MTTKEQILLFLEANRDKSVSGQELAQQLQMTRAGIWKAMKQLEKDGYQIEAVNNRGYRLKQAPDVLSEVFIAEGIAEGTTGFVKEFEIQVKKETGSTNNDLKQFVAAGVQKDMVLLAEKQTCGRGRRGRAFYSPEDTGLYMSFLVHPNVGPQLGAMLTTLAAVATAKAIEKVTEKETKIKWVNDIFVNRKKVCGILTECSVSMEEQLLEYAIIGIGINLYDPKEGFPAELAHKAGSIMGDSKPVENLKNDLAIEVIKNFAEYYSTFPDMTFFPVYKEKSFVIGKKVRLLPTGAEEGSEKDTENLEQVLVLDIDERCGLIVQHADQTTEILSNGEISIRDWSE